MAGLGRADFLAAGRACGGFGGGVELLVEPELPLVPESLVDD